MDYSVIFLAIIAAIVCYQLYAKLGTRNDGDDERKAPLRPYQDQEPAPQTTLAEVDVPQEQASVEDIVVPGWVNDIRKRYPAFEEKTFLAGAKSAYELVVEAFGDMEIKPIKKYVDPAIMTAFSDFVEARKSREETSDLQFVGIETAEITGHEVTQKEIFVSVAFTSNQIRVVRNKEGEVIEGDPNRIDLVKDHWRFRRSTNARDPNWILDATGLPS